MNNKQLVENNQKNEINEKFNEFIELLNKISNIDLEINNIEIIYKFYNIVKQNQKFKKYLLTRKTKIFYNGNVQLFESFNIRKLLEKTNYNNQKKIWNYLQLFYVLQSENNDNYTLKLIKDIENKFEEKSDANCLINDVVSNIKELLSNLEDTEDSQTNPLEKLMSISKTISEKYAEDIKKGNITIEEIMTSITSSLEDNNLFNEDMFKNLNEEKIGNMFNNIINSDQVKNLNLDSLMGSLGNNLGGDLAGNLVGNSNVGDIFKTLLKNNIQEKVNVEDKPLEDKQLEQMEKYFENISTDNPTNVPITIDKENLDNNSSNSSSSNGNGNGNGNLDLGNLTNMLFSQINQNKDSLNQNINNMNIDFDQLNNLKDNLMNKLSDDQKNEINNLTDTLLKGFNMKEE